MNRLDTNLIPPHVLTLARTLARMTLAAVPPEYHLHPAARAYMDAFGGTSRAREAARHGWREAFDPEWFDSDDCPVIVLHLRRCISACARACTEGSSAELHAERLREAAAETRHALLWAAQQSFAAEADVLGAAYGCAEGAVHPGLLYQDSLVNARKRHEDRVAAIGVMLDRVCATVPGVIER